MLTSNFTDVSDDPYSRQVKNNFFCFADRAFQYNLSN